MDLSKISLHQHTISPMNTSTSSSKVERNNVEILNHVQNSNKNSIGMDSCRRNNKIRSASFRIIRSRYLQLPDCGSLSTVQVRDRRGRKRVEWSVSSVSFRDSRSRRETRTDDGLFPSRLMASNTLILKSTIFPEWYADRVQPWVQ